MGQKYRIPQKAQFGKNKKINKTSVFFRHGQKSYPRVVFQLPSEFWLPFCFISELYLFPHLLSVGILRAPFRKQNNHSYLLVRDFQEPNLESIPPGNLLCQRPCCYGWIRHLPADASRDQNPPRRPELRPSRCAARRSAASRRDEGCPGGECEKAQSSVEDGEHLQNSMS